MDQDKRSKDVSFREHLAALLAWVADRDPVAAARLVAEYAEELRAELSQAQGPAR